jgi:threonine dehydrogenase-like Zn-dependent dehydrogenase
VKAVTFQAPEAVRVEEVPDPRLRAPTDAIVRVSVSAICGSDLHVYHGRERGLDRGTVLGHEFVGEVVEVGADVALARGTRVVSPFTTSCGACWYCERGLTARCVRGELFGWVEKGRGLHGAQAELVRVPFADATLVPTGALDPETALFAGDVFSTGLSTAESAGVGPQTVVAVIGCGPVGLSACLASRALRAARVFAVDRLPERLALARAFGAEPIDFSTEDAAARLRDATDGRGADAVLEAVGSPAATRLAYDLVRPGGTIAACGVHTETAFAFAPGEAYDKNLTYRAGRSSARHWLEKSLTLLAGEAAPLARIVSHRMALDDAVRGYDVFARRLEGCTKVLLTS